MASTSREDNINRHFIESRIYSRVLNKIPQLVGAKNSSPPPPKNFETLAPSNFKLSKLSRFPHDPIPTNNFYTVPRYLHPV